ncbi:hypothetical protein SUGI_1498850 [Cryptomeria japonica]|uniref:Uncharacterized protein n=1 Tax=Cryptomeria japonica TaxID=3369 RepID=A0AAD3RPY3_CRYJA|nr:hypothetical protein SUGI_1497570 [Cryptomeria japonica]GLJ59246.1 hypothetical protein SUGI_1498850 [Cryptomeria japonica]
MRSRHLPSGAGTHIDPSEHKGQGEERQLETRRIDHIFSTACTHESPVGLTQILGIGGRVGWVGVGGRPLRAVTLTILTVTGPPVDDSGPY